MSSRYYYFWLVAGMLGLLIGCASSDKNHSGPVYEPTGQVETVFQVSQVPKSCGVFAHLLGTMPAAMTTHEFGKRISDEAKAKGADVILIGQARQSTSESEFNFAYFGPVSEYSIREWSGWSFAREEWGEQGSWTALGYNEWTRGDVHFDYPVMVQAALIRCQK